MKLKRDRRLAVEISATLAVKLLILMLLWLLFFSPAHRVSVDASSISHRLFPPTASDTGLHGNDGS